MIAAALRVPVRVLARAGHTKGCSQRQGFRAAVMSSSSSGRVVVRTDKAPAPLGGAPYNQAIKANGMVFVSGQIALDPATDKMVEGGVEVQAEQCLKNMAAILTEAGASMGDVVKTTILLAEIEDFAAVNAVYATFFPVDPPARATYACKALPGGARVEIDSIAVVPSE